MSDRRPGDNVSFANARALEMTMANAELRGKDASGGEQSFAYASKTEKLLDVMGINVESTAKIDAHVCRD